MDRFHALSLGKNRTVLDTEVGHLRKVELDTGARVIAPLHVAPWVTDAPVDRASVTSPVELSIAGDFLCAPFCANDVEGGPIHGAPANEPWRLIGENSGQGSAAATYALSRGVLGAEVRKTLRLVADQPFLYQEHAFKGGAGFIPVGHHAMIRAAGTVALSFSPLALYLTPDTAPEPDPSRGRSALRYPSSGTDLSTVPLAAGGTVDLLTYPNAERHEDVVSMAEAPGHVLGWAAAVRDAEDDIVLFVKDARVLPTRTMWMSNGGRDYPPWNGRHTRVLGLEDTRAFGAAGHRASIEPNAFTERGIQTAFNLKDNPVLRYAIGAVPRPGGWTRIRSVATDGNALVLTDVLGKTVSVPFDAAWLLQS